MSVIMVIGVILLMAIFNSIGVKWLGIYDKVFLMRFI